MNSLNFIVALSLILGCYLLVADVRPSYSMPIGGDRFSDNYKGIYNLITQRLQNLSQANPGNDQDTRRSFVLNKTIGNVVRENSTVGITSVLNNTIFRSRNSNSSQRERDQNNRRSFVPVVAGYTGNPMTTHAAAGDLPSESQPTTANQSAPWRQTERKPVEGNTPVWPAMAGNKPAGNLLVGIPHSGNHSLGNLSASNLTAGKPMATNTTLVSAKPLLRETVAGKKPVSGDTQIGSSQVPSYSTNTGQAGAPMFSSSSNAGPIFHEDLSGIYSNAHGGLSKYDRKSTIYRPNSADYAGQTARPRYAMGTVNPYGRYSTQYPGFKKSAIFTPNQNTTGYQNYQQVGNKPSNYQHSYPPGYISYPSFHGQQGRRGFQVWPGYHGYPATLQQEQRVHFPSANDVRDRVPQTPNKFKDPDASHVSSETPEDAVYPTSNIIQIKPPDQWAAASTEPSSQSLSSDNTDTEGSTSGSASGFDESNNMENAADYEEPQALSGSGSGYDDGYMNPSLIGGASDIAFMLAGTKNKPPAFPAPGLPMNLTRQQAIDIYKSAMYFAGLMGADNTDSDSEESGDHDSDDIDDDDDKNGDSFTDEDSDDITLTDNDVKEALAASSGDLDSSSQEASGVEASGNQSEAAPVDESQDKASKEENKATKSDNEAQAQAPESQKKTSDEQSKESLTSGEERAASKEKSDTKSTSVSASKDESTVPKEDNRAQKEQNRPENVEPVQGDDTGAPPPVDADGTKADSGKQADESNEEDYDTPPPDETLMRATQANYAADQQAEKALYFLTHTRLRGAYSSPNQRTIICKDTIQKISCPPRQKIRILNADFGDTGAAGCLKEANPVVSGPCRTPGAYETVKRECEGFEDCELSASNDVFGDACPDANKYLDVNYDCVNNAAPSLHWHDLWKYHSKPHRHEKALKKDDSPSQDVKSSSPGLQPLVQQPQYRFYQVPYAPPAPAYSQASYQPAPQYVNPLPPPVSYAPVPYQAPPPASYAGLPNLLPPSPYIPPDPCNPCNTCAQCSLPVCSPCGSTCQALTCPPRIPAKLQPLWQQWNERTADMSRMEMAALIISPLPKLSPTKAPESSESSGAAEGSESGEPTLDEDALYEASKRSEIQRIKPQKTSKKTHLTAHKKTHKKNDSDQGFLRNSDLIVSSGDASSGSSS